MSEDTTQEKRGDWTAYLRHAGNSALAYGLGLFAGDVLSFLLFRIAPSLRNMDLSKQISTLLFGFILAFIILGIGSGLGGFLGGRSLTAVGQRHSKRGYAWRSALSMALLYGPLVFLAMFTTSLFSFYYVMETPVETFIYLFMIIGAIFGAFFGLVFGVLTIRWRGLGWVILATVIGFGIGGMGLGAGFHAYMISIVEGVLDSGAWWWFLLGVLWFGAAGGAALGLVYYRLSQVEEREIKGRNWLAYIGCVGMIVAAVVVFFFLRQILSAAADYLMPRSANLSSILVSDVTGTHWADKTDVSDLVGASGGAYNPQVAANVYGDMAFIWTSGTEEINYLPAEWKEEATSTVLGAAVPVPAEKVTTAPPQAAVDNGGKTHIVWRTADDILYSVCQGEACSSPVILPAGNDLACVGTSSFSMEGEDLAESAPAIAISGQDTVMVTWLHGSGVQLYGTWSSDLAAEELNPEIDCVMEQQVFQPEQTRLAAGSGDRFGIVYKGDGNITTIAYRSGEWSDIQNLGSGELPQVYIDPADNPHYAWCNEGGTVSYRASGQEIEVSSTPCQSRPELGMDSQANMHIVWYSGEVIDVTGTIRAYDIIYESIQSAGEWTEPMIVANTGDGTQPSMSSNPDGVLHLVWSAGESSGSPLLYTSQVQYVCDESDLTGFSRVMFDVASSEQYRSPDSVVPYCQNQYNRLLFTPFPMPDFSDEPAQPHGAFDDYNEMILDAEYEVLLATMEYDEDKNQDSPGYVLAVGITELYHRVAENPENYPRGMTVKIVLGNPPRLEMNTDLWRLLENLRNAGLPEMVNEDIGWRLEIANFEGHMPHSHVKVLVVDGKIAVSTGFNYQYHHYPEEHPSEAGEGTLDIGIQVTGPAAQDVRMVFDELWEGATQRYCEDLYAPYPLWQWGCKDSQGVPEHVPEVTRYYPTDGETQVFSMLRSEVLELSDDQIKQVVANADENLDVLQAMFAMPLVCYLNHLYDLCGPEQAMPYIQSIIKAAENGAHVRLLLKMTPFMGTEAAISVEVIYNALRERGIEDRVEIRAFPIPLHAKTASIDNEMVIIGSQNYHYTAYGEGGGLVEHNLGVFDPQAVEDYQRVFDYYWDLAGE